MTTGIPHENKSNTSLEEFYISNSICRLITQYLIWKPFVAKYPPSTVRDPFSSLRPLLKFENNEIHKNKSHVEQDDEMHGGMNYKDTEP
jgi:hypothetical protein